MIWHKYRVTLEVCALHQAAEVPAAESGAPLVRDSLERLLATSSQNGEYLADGEVLSVEVVEN